MTYAQIRKLIDADIERLGTRTALAAEIGMSIQHLSTVLNTRAPLPERVANYYGYTPVRVTTVKYERLP